MKKFNQKGIAPLMIVLGLVIVGVVGFTVYTVNQNNSDNNDSSTSQENVKWEDRPENVYYKPYAGDNRFRLGEGYTEIYKNDSFGYEYSFYPGFPDSFPNGPRDKFVKESTDKSQAEFTVDVSSVFIFASKVENPNLENCRTERVAFSLRAPEFTEQPYRDTSINQVNMRVYSATKPAGEATGDIQNTSITRLIFSAPYGSRCINVTYDVNTEAISGGAVYIDAGPISSLKLTD